MALLDSVSKFIEKEKLFRQEDHLLCAVSGGRDSMVMLDLLRCRGYDVLVGHVNYMLRGQDAIQDELLVQDYCEVHQLPCQVLRLTESQTTDLLSGGLQEKARDIRYAWLRELLVKHKASYILTAHHMEDQAETLLQRALRSAGTKGLAGIASANGDIRRPLLKSTRDEIISYQREAHIPYREDSSNQKDDYDRNYIRNKVIPVIKKRWPHASESLSRSADILARDYHLLSGLISDQTHRWLINQDDITRFGALSKFRQLPHAVNMAYHLLSSYQWSSDQIEKIIEEDHPSGATFISPSHLGLIDRDYLIIKKQKKQEQSQIVINEASIIDSKLGTLTLSSTPIRDSIDERYIEWLSLAKITWPLMLRNWKEGDTIKPLGMNGQKKLVSDILIDQKVDIFEKEDQLVLVDGSGEIIWVMGRKLSDTFKYSDQTKEYLKISWTSK